MNWITELFGLAGSLLVAISYIYQGKLLRVINLIGSILFVIYGFLLGGVSIVILNGITIFIHLYYIMKEEK